MKTEFNVSFFWPILVFLLVMFWGQPDLYDAFMANLSQCHPTTEGTDQ